MTWERTRPVGKTYQRVTGLRSLVYHRGGRNYYVKRLNRLCGCKWPPSPHNSFFSKKWSSSAQSCQAAFPFLLLRRNVPLVLPLPVSIPHSSSHNSLYMCVFVFVFSLVFVFVFLLVFVFVFVFLLVFVFAFIFDRPALPPVRILHPS